MARRFRDPRIRFLLGDVRDLYRLRRAFAEVDTVIHAAALKRVPQLEYDPLECKKTNIDGAQNVIEAALDLKVERVMALSTDKAAAAHNAYGKSKAFAESLFIAANSYSGQDGTRFSCVRYGNVVGSRGSLIPLLLEKKAAGEPMPLTSPKMSRFWITLGDATRFIRNRIEEMVVGGAIYVPIIPSVWVTDVIKAVAPESEVVKVGIRPGEKLAETLITEDEAVIHYRVLPTQETYYRIGGIIAETAGAPYRSDTNESWLSVDEIRRRLPAALAEAA